MNQTRTMSFIEAVVNVLIGAAVGLLSQLIIFPLYGIQVQIGDNLMILLWFTLISVVRSYAIRRWFNEEVHYFAEYILVCVAAFMLEKNE